ncbi:MAG: ZIP family metal transporter [Clostridia bacterium]|nr:ZIP family metal transporter [Clostridia bacterium]
MISGFDCVLKAFIATLFTWGCTALGAAIVFVFGNVNRKSQDAMLGFSAGVMIAASFWSLLLPCVEYANELNMNAAFVMCIGFVFGGILLFLKESLLKEKKTAKHSMLMFSITLHNIPEGLAVGVAFGSLINTNDLSTLSNAYMLALGIGIQNIPEGSAVSLPMRRNGFSKRKSFFYGQLSAFVEVISGIIGALIAVVMKHTLPFLLSFAAGAMIYVTVMELIPESQGGENPKIITLITLFGFILMSVLDIAFG